MVYLYMLALCIISTVSDGAVQSGFKPQCRAGICDDRPECPRTSCHCIYPSGIDCSLYYQCINGKPYQYRCSPGLLFNSKTLTCDYSSNVNCSADFQTTSTTSEYASTATTEDKIPTTEAHHTSNATDDIPESETETVTISVETTTVTEAETTASKAESTNPPTTEPVSTTTFQTPSDVASTIKSTEFITTTTTSKGETEISTEQPTTTENNPTTTVKTSSGEDLTTEKSTRFIFSTTITPTEGKETPTELLTTKDVTKNLMTTTIQYSTDKNLTTITDEIASPSTTAFPFADFSCPSRFGLFPDPKSCFRFYHCSHWVPYHKWCPSGLHFNPSLRVCDWPYRAGCGSNLTTATSEITTPFQPKPNNITHCDCDCCELPVPGDCSAYILCIDKVAFEMSCANGLYFNPMTGTCDFPENVICEPEIQCPAPFGRFPYPNSCSNFLDCRNGEKRVKKCPDGLNFDSTNETCSWTGSCSGNPDPSSLPDLVDGDICNGCNYCFKQNPQDCTRYIKCSNNEAYEYQCSPGLFFNPSSEVCDHDYNVNCPEPVPLPSCPSTNGYFPHPGDCSLYLHCVNGISSVKQCPGILHFDPTKKHCDWPWAAGCRDNETNPTPEPLPETRCGCDCCVEPVENDCRSFVLCVNSVAFQRSCSSGLLYNPLTENCDFAENVKCEIVPDPVGYECPEYQGLFPHPDNCRKFIHCAHDYPYIKDCPANLHFNPRLKVCDWPYAAGCEDLPVTQPPPENPDFPCDLCNSCFVPNENDCAAYTFCVNGTGHKLRCSGDLVFNPEIEACDLLDNVNCPNRPNLECSTPDGLFPADVCTKFIHCSNGIPYVKDCPAGLHFNQVSLVCDWPENAYCDNPSTKPPMPDDQDVILNQTCNCDCCLLPNKYDCSRYFLCLNGLLHQGRCADGLLFNPLKQNCDLEKNVNCNELSPLCKEPNGLFPNTKNCSTFYLCVNGVAHLEQCSNGKHFNAEEKQCLNPCEAKCDANYECKSSTIQEAITTERTLFPTSTTAKSTTKSMTTTPTTITTTSTATPSTTMSSLGATNSTVSDTTKPTYSPSTTEGFLCEKPYGRFPVEGNCSLFLTCNNYSVSVSSCSQGLHFSRQHSTCENPCEAKCDNTLDCSTPSSSVTPTTSTTEKPTTCSDPNGFYPVKDDCNSFYLCSDHLAYIIKCPSGLHFSAEFHVCEHPCDAKCDENISCPTSSTPNPTSTVISSSVSTISPLCEVADGVNGVEGDCTSYYLCTTGYPYLFKCPEGTHFNNHSHNCEDPCVAKCDPKLDCSSTTEMTTTTTTEKISTLSPHCPTLNGLYPAENCESFYLCSNGQEHLIRCPPDLHYSVYHETCENPCDAHCNTSIDCTPSTTTTTTKSTTTSTTKSTTTSTTKSTTTIQPLSPQCLEPNGLFDNPKDCETFYHCSNGRAHLKRCPSGLHFSRDDEQCERPCVAGCDISIVCPTEIPDVAGNCSCNNCFLPDPSDCSAYYFCSSGHLTKGYCPYGMLFSKVSNMCDSEDSVDCEATGDPSMCPDPNGRFPYPGNCKRFLRCEDSIAHIEECKGGLEFDPDSRLCVKPNGHCGTSTTDPRCSRPSGLFPHSTNCSLFYHCENGVAYLKNCTRPLVFNPDTEVCDWPDQVKCGREPSNIIEESTEQSKSPTGISTMPPRARTSSSHFVPSTTLEPRCHEVPGVICPCACRVPTYDECSSFFQCQEDGTACKKFCPEGLYFNKKTMVCDMPSNVECRDFFFTAMRKFKSSNMDSSLFRMTPYKRI